MHSAILDSEERQTRILDRVLAIGQAAQEHITANPKKVYELIAEAVCKTTEADCAILYPYHPAFGEFYDLVNVAAYGLRHELQVDKRTNKRKGLTARVHTKGEIICENVEEIEWEEAHPYKDTPLVAREEIKAFMGLSLTLGENVLGILYVDYRSPHHFSEDEKRIIRLFGQQAALAVSNSWTSRLAAIRADTVAKFKTVGQSLVTIEDLSRTLDSVLDEIAQSAQEVLDADLVDLYQYVQGRTEFVLPPTLVGDRFHPDLKPTKIYNDDVAVATVMIGEPRYFDDAQREASLTGDFEIPHEGASMERFVIRENVASCAIIPLMAAGETVGVMFVNYRTPQFFAPGQRDVMESFASQAAIAIRNARLYSSEQRRNRDLEILNQSVTKLSQSLDAEQAYQAILEAVVDTLECDYCTIFLVEPDDMLVSHISGGKLFAEPPKLHFKRDEGLAGWVYEHDQSLIVNNTAENPRYKRAPWETEVKPRSIILSPMRRGEKVIGVVSADLDYTDAFDENDLRSLDTLTRHASTVLQNIEYFNDFQILHNAANVLTEQPTLKEIFQTAVNAALGTLHCRHSTLFILDKRVGELVAVDRVGSRHEASEVRSFKLGEGLAGIVAETGVPLIVNDAASDDRFVEGQYIPVSAPRSIILAPIKIDDEVEGVISADKDEVDGFTQHNLEVLETLALDVGITLRLRRQQNMLAAIAEFQQAVSDLLPIQDQLEQIREKLSELMDTSSIFIALYDEGKGIIHFPLACERGKVIADEAKIEEQPYAPRRFDARRGLTEWVIRHKESLLVEDSEAWPTEEQIEEAFRKDIKCCLLSPMIVQDRVIGVIGLQNFNQPRAFDKADRDLLLTIASQAAIALENARLFYEVNQALERRVKVLSALNEVGQTLTSGIRLKQDEILELIYQQARRLTDAQDLYIALYDDATQMIRFGLAIEGGQRVEIAEPRKADREKRGKTEEIIFTRQPILHTMQKEAEDWYALQGHQEFIGRVSPSYLGVPMLVGEKVLGMIALLDWKQEHAYDQLDLQALASMANQAAIALDNAELYYEVNQALERRVQALSALNEVGQALTSDLRLSEDEILELTYQQVRRLTGTQDMYIALYDDATQIIRFGLAMEGGQRIEIAESRKADMERWGKTEEIILTGQPLLHKTQKEAEEWYTLPGHQEFIGRVQPSYLGVPMMVGEKVLGVIAVYDLEREHAYDELDLQVLASMASQAAIAIDSARLFESTRQIARQRQRRLELLQQISEKMAQASLDPDEVLELVADGANAVTSSDLTSIYRYDQEASSFTRGVRVSRGGDIEQDAPENFPGPHELPTRIAQSQKAVFVEDIEKHPEDFAFVRRHRLKAVAGLPLTILAPQGLQATVGVLFLNFREPHTFPDDEQEILRHLANQAAVAIAYAGAQESAQAKEQLAALGTAAATLQHRLGNTINVILPAVMRLRYRVGDDPNNMEILDTIERNALFATEVIRRMQTPLRQEPFILTNINGLLRDAIQKVIQDTDRFPDILLTSDVPGLTRNDLDFAAPPQGQITITTDLDESLPKTYASSGQLTEVFRVLVENAIKAIYPKSGSVTILCKFEDDRLRPCVEIAVSDTGKGIDEKTRPRLFHQPVPRKEFGEGAGLGLWLSNIIVRSHQGSIELQSSKLKQGSTFLVRLPILKQAPPSPTSQRGEIS